MKMAECFQKGLLKRTSPDMENALRSLELSRSNIEDAMENLSIHRYLKEKYPELETLANILDSYRRFRHDAIYGLDFAIDEKEAKAALDSAKEFLEKIEIFIGEDK